MDVLQLLQGVKSWHRGITVSLIVMYKSVGKNGTKECSVHAEVMTWYKIPKRFRKDIILVVIRKSVTGELACSKPCDKCQLFLTLKKIKTYYSE